MCLGLQSRNWSGQIVKGSSSGAIVQRVNGQRTCMKSPWRAEERIRPSSIPSVAHPVAVGVGIIVGAKATEVVIDAFVAFQCTHEPKGSPLLVWFVAHQQEPDVFPPPHSRKGDMNLTRIELALANTRGGEGNDDLIHGSPPPTCGR